MAIRKVNGHLCIEFQQSGIRVFRRLPHAATQAQAREYETRLRREIIDRVHLGHAPELTLAKVVELWLRDNLTGKKDQRMPAANAKYLAPFLDRPVREAAEAARDARATWTRTATSTAISALRVSNADRRLDASQITGASMAAGKSGRGLVTVHSSGATISPATINRRLAVLKAALRYAYKQGWAEQNYGQRIEMMREPPHREVYLSPEQVRAIAAEMATEEGRAAVMLLAYTGLRCGELFAITAGDIGKDSLTVRQSKSGKARTVPLSGPARSLAASLPLSLTYSALQWDFRSARVAAGLPHVRLHDLRHTFASMLINSGTDLYTVGKLLGHSTPATTARYAHLAQDALRKAVRRLR